MSPKVSWPMVKRWTVRVGLALVVLVGVIGWSFASSRGAEVDNLTTAQARNRPVTDYNVAHNAAEHCIGSYDRKTRADQDQFDADIAALVVADRTDSAAIQAAQVALAVDEAALKVDSANELAVDELCPEPLPPTFDENGKVLTGTVVRELHPVTASPR